MSFQYPSTIPNFLPSSGIWARMSAELNMGSRYIQVAWHLSHWSNMSCIIVSFDSHSCVVQATWYVNSLLRHKSIKFCLERILMFILSYLLTFCLKKNVNLLPLLVRILIFIFRLKSFVKYKYVYTFLTIVITDSA